MLKRVSIQNFKSLKDVTLDLQKVNLLIGPNNSGKSNFLKALEFFNNIKSFDNDIDESTLYNKKYLNNFSISFSFETNSIDKKYNQYRVLSRNKDNDSLSVKNNLYIGHFESHLYIDETPLWLINNDSQHIVYAILKSFKYHTNDLKIYSPDPNQFKNPAHLGSDQYINSSGSNIVSYLFNLSQNRKKDFIELEKNFASCVGDLVGIGTPAVQTEDGNKLKLKFFDKNDNDYWVEEVSEGVLYFLALLCIINQPDPPKLLLLEEPEKGIHPRRIWEIMRFIFQLAEEKDIQIILTTHNEHVVNAFASMPEAVFVFEKNEEGATEVKNLKRDIIDVSNKKSEENGLEPIDFTSDLGKSWLYGLIGGVPDEII